MKLFSAFAIAGVVLFGSTAAYAVPTPQPGQNREYRELVLGFFIKQGRADGISFDFLLPMANCLANTAIASLTPEQLARADAFARAEIKLTDAEMKVIDKQLSVRIVEDEFDDAVEKRCPAAVKSLKAWRKANN